MLLTYFVFGKAAINGVYSNVLGFLGGVNYAILLARICLESFPDLDSSCRPSVLLKLFFRKYAVHEWPAPVVLTNKINHEAPPNVKKMQVWDPVLNHQDGRHVMPIITPVYPSSKYRRNGESLELVFVLLLDWFFLTTYYPFFQ